MRQLRNPVEKAAPLALRALLLLLLVELSALLLLSAQAAPSEQLLWRAVAVLLAGVALAPMPGAVRGAGSGLPLVWAALGAATLLLGTGLATSAAVWSRETLLTAFGCGLLLALFHSAGTFLAHWRGDRRLAARGILGVLLLSLTLPLWLSPLVLMPGAGRWLVDTVIALCPASFLAALANVDYLRADWFYRHTPYGGLRYDYPDPLVLGLAMLLVLALLGWLSLRLRRRLPAINFPDVMEP